MGQLPAFANGIGRDFQNDLLPSMVLKIKEKLQRDQ
jgi:hypothetical protein